MLGSVAYAARLSPPVATTFLFENNHLQPPLTCLVRPSCLQKQLGNLWATLQVRRKKTHRSEFWAILGNRLRL